MIFLNTSDIKVWENYQKDIDLTHGFATPREFPAKSLEYASRYFDEIKGEVIVECGTGLQGELSGDSMLYWFRKTEAKIIHCIDMDIKWINTVRDSLGSTERVKYHEDNCFNVVPGIKNIDLIYMDYWVGDGREREKSYLNLYNKSSFPKLILIDDSDHSRPWKQTMIVPVAMVSHGYRLVYMGRQTLLVRKDVAEGCEEILLKLRSLLN